MLIRRNYGLGGSFAALVVFLFAITGSAMADAGSDSLMNKAEAAWQKGDPALALELANKAVQASPTNAQCYYVRGRIYAGQGEHEKALGDFDHAIALEPRGAELYHLRGCEHFKVGHIDESLADFDKFLQFVPKRAPYHWQRGISCYYAGRYEEGRKQFELHQTVNPSDVENAVWHFLCVARLEGVEKARAALIPIKDDRRAPMTQIFDLYSGKSTPDAVFASATSPDALFYANLYVGLYYEATGNDALAGSYIGKAARNPAEGNYMVDVARVHEKILQKKKLRDAIRDAKSQQSAPPKQP
jgi:lipoprotein NlpI